MAYINNLGQVRIGVRGWVAAQSGAIVTDSDATAFVTAAGITDTTQISALNTLVTDLKTYGLWTKMKAIYPFVGGSAASHKFNLKDPRDLDASYRLVFNGGGTHSSTGYLGNGTNSYGRTFILQNSLQKDSVHLSYYNRYNSSATYNNFMGCVSSPNTPNWGLYIAPVLGMNPFSAVNSIEAYTTDPFYTSVNKYWLVNRSSSTQEKIFINGVLGSTINKSSTTLTSNEIYVGAINVYGNSGINEAAFASIGDGLTDTEASNFYISVQKFQTTLGRHVGTPYVSDPDAIAFLMAAGITDGTQAAAINTLVIRMKADGVWTKMKAIYPFVGGSAASHKFNLKDPRDLDAAYRLVFNGGWTHTGTGALPNGTTGWADTKLSPSSVLTINSTHFSFYSRTNNAQNGADIGTGLIAPVMAMRIKYSDNNGYFDAYSYPTGRITVNMGSINSTSLFIHSRTSTSVAKVYRSGIQIGGGSVPQGSSSLPSGNVFISSTNDSVAKHFSNRETAFVSIGDGLTDTEATSLYTAVQAFQTTLGRQTDVPLVSDTDAQAFLNATNITSFQQASAVNKLVVDLKAAGVWTKMKAIYPFVGGSAASHKFNLKDPRDLDAAFRLVFNGGGTHGPNGYLGNGSNSFARTYITHNTLSQNNTHVSFYNRYNSTSNYNNFIGCIDYPGTSNGIGIYPINQNNFYMLVNSIESVVNIGHTSVNKFWMINRNNSTQEKVFINGSLSATINKNSQTGTSKEIYLGSINGYGNAGINESSFASIGDGLTDAEATALYTAVETYQTSLGRGVNTPIYNNGLVLNLDAGNANSYPGTGTTWFDLAAGNNGTLVNGPTYDTANGGSLLFDGVNDYVDLGSNFKFVDKDLTLDFWLKCTDNSLSNWHDIIVMATPDQSSGVGLFKNRSGNSSNGSFQFSFIGNHLYSTLIGSQIVSAGVLNLTGVVKKESGLYKLYLYVNGVLDKSLNTTISSYDMNTFTNFFARIGSGGPTYPEIWQGNIYSGKVYTRALSATEILNNFNSTRGRFGL